MGLVLCPHVAGLIITQHVLYPCAAEHLIPAIADLLPWDNMTYPAAFRQPQY